MTRWHDICPEKGIETFVIPPRDDGLGQRKSFCRNPAAGGARCRHLFLETKHG